MKEVLLFSFRYPPSNAAASRRSGCMAKYLRNFGWLPIVISSETPPGYPIDYDCVQNLPSDIIVKRIKYRSKGFLNSLFCLEGIGRFFKPGLYPSNWIRNALGILPDVLAENNISTIWATYPPIGAFYLAHYCSRKFGIPWIADFRDFPGELGLPDNIRPKFRLYREIFESKKLIKSASIITTVSKGLAVIIGDKFRRNVEIIMNGFDPEELDCRSNGKFDKFNIVYTGSYYISPRPILDALSILLDSKMLSEEDMVVSFYCNNSSELKNALAGHPYMDIVRVYPWISRVKCGEICRSNLVLMLPGPHPSGIVTSKIFTYMAAQRPILAGPGTNDCIKEILGQTNAGVACSSIQDMADVLLRWYQEWKETGMVKYHGRKEAIMKYSREKQAGQLAELLDSIYQHQTVS